MFRTEDRKIFFYEILGMVFIILLGSAFHFTFELSGQNPIVGSISAVNESVWEHLKLVYWPSLFFLLIEFWLIRDKSKNFFFAKAMGICLGILIIPLTFYVYTALFEESLVIDILTFIVAVIIGQIISYKILTFEQLNRKWRILGIFILIILGLAFILFTFYPPHLPIFRDGATGNYGI